MTESQICITCIRSITINMLNFDISLRSALLKIKSFSTWILQMKKARERISVVTTEAKQKKEDKKT